MRKGNVINVDDKVKLAGFIIGIIFVVIVELVECQREKGAKA